MGPLLCSQKWWLQSRSVLSSFGVALMSWRVNFQLVRSALHYSACRIFKFCKLQCWSYYVTSISEHLRIRKMRLCQIHTLVISFNWCFLIMQILSRDSTCPENNKKSLNKNGKTFCCEFLNRTGLGQCVMQVSTKLCLAFLNLLLY